jgi:hypothetical protein
MLNRSVLGSGPVQFFGSGGTLYFVPFINLSVVPVDAVDAANWLQAIASLNDTDSNSPGELLKEQMNRGDKCGG